MSAFFSHRDNCRICAGDDLELVVHLMPTPAGDNYISEEYLNDIQEIYPLNLFLCQSCGLVQLLDVVSPEVLYSKYIYNTSISLGLAEHFQKYADEILFGMNIPEKTLVIDIGSNDGTLLKCFQNRSMRVLGVDPAREVAKKANESGVETLPYCFDIELARKIKGERGPAAIITANNVFANIDDLINMVGGIRELLSPDGVFVFETGYVVDMIQKTVLDNIYHEHLSYFAVKPLDIFFRSNGMELIDITRVPTKGGSLRGIAQISGGSRKASFSVNELITLEKNIGFDHPEIFRSFAIKINNIKKELMFLLQGLKLQKKNIACYGASVGVTTLIYYFELGKMLSFIIDDNESRHNLFSPGYHIPVFPSKIIYEQKPDYVLIMPWRYAEIIEGKHKAFLKQGGRFIVPLPEVKII